VRLAVILTCLGVASLGGAADHHLLRDSDSDGKADPCPNPAHREHYRSDDVECGGRFDIDGDGVPERLFCNIQSALDTAREPGDTVEIHQGVWTEKDTSERRVENLCVRDQEHRAMAVVRSCKSCDEETDRRIVRGGVIGTAADPRELVVLDPAQGTSVVALVLGESRSAAVRFLTISGFTIADANHLGCEFGGRWIGALAQRGDTDDLIVENMNIDLDSWDSAEECAAHVRTNEAGFAAVGETIYGSFADIDRITIRNNRVRACSLFAFKKGSDTPAEARLNGLEISGNDVMLFGDVPEHVKDNLTAFECKGCSDMAIYNNVLRCDQSDQHGKWRGSGGRLWFFNNVIDRCDALGYSQSTRFTQAYYFNNTFRNAGGKSGKWVLDPDGPTRSRNNSFTGSFRAVWSGLAEHDDVGYDHWLGRGHTYMGKGAPGTDAGHFLCAASKPCDEITSLADCAGRGGCRPSDTDERGDRPFRLGPGSPLIDAGTNDPLGQGPNRCSIEVWPGNVVDCTRDPDGDDRTKSGRSWDVGADELAGSPAKGP
jgi:hypothetical protein